MGGEFVCAHSWDYRLGPAFQATLLVWWCDMEVGHLQDRLYWGLNRTANILGRVTDAYRPVGVSEPVSRSNRYLQLRAAFSRADGNFDQAVGYGVALWRGHFDASYTNVGDYLVQGDETWFIASQQSLLPVLCVKTNRVISISRQLSPSTGTTYDPTTGATSPISVISRWPVSMLGTGTEGKSTAQLPGDTGIPSCIVLLPSVHEQILQPADIVVDEYGMRGVIVASELSGLGWRLNIRQVTT